MVVIEVESISLKDSEIEVWQHTKTLCGLSKGLKPKLPLKTWKLHE
jgi:hypothetical protein